MNLGRRKW